MYKGDLMSKKVNVKVCCGTACFVMGGSDLLTLDEYLSADEMAQVEFEAVTCLNTCRQSDEEKPPFVTINNEVHNRVNMTTLLALIREKLDGGV